MAKLREERRLIKIIVDYHLNVDSTDENAFNMMLASQAGAISKIDIIKYCMDHKVFNWERKSQSNKTNGIFDKWTKDRRAKIEALINACIVDNFLQPITENVKISGKDISLDFGLMPTSKGTDLLQFIGFLDAVLGKFGITVGVITGGLGLFFIEILFKLVLLKFGIRF